MLGLTLPLLFISVSKVIKSLFLHVCTCKETTQQSPNKKTLMFTRNYSKVFLERDNSNRLLFCSANQKLRLKSVIHGSLGPRLFRIWPEYGPRFFLTGLVHAFSGCWSVNDRPTILKKWSQFKPIVDVRSCRFWSADP